MANVKPFKLVRGQGVQFKTGDTVDPVFGGTGLSSYHIGDILAASSTTVLAPIVAVTVGNVLLSSGVSTLPVWGKVDLTIHVSGTLQAPNGGTGISTYTIGNYLNAASSSTLQQRTPAQVLSDIGAASVSHNHDGSNITTGTIAPARLGTGTLSASTFLSGNGTWQAVSVVLGSTTITVGAAPTLVIAGLTSVTATNFIGNSSSSTNIAVTTDNSSNVTFYPLIASASNGTLPVFSSSNGLQYNPSTGRLTATAGQFGAVTLTGVAQITNSTDSTNLSTGALLVSGGMAVTKAVNIGGNLSVQGDVELGNAVGGFIEIGVIGGMTTFLSSTASMATNQVLATVSGLLYRSAEFRIQAVDITDQIYHTATILVVHNGTVSDFVEFGDIALGGRCGTFSVGYAADTFTLTVSPSSSNVIAYKIVAMLTKV
jgi:hypothetical protein